MSRALRGRGPQFGLTVYPSPSARKEKRIGYTPFLRCIQCGMPNDTRKTAWSNIGEGLSDPVAVSVTAAPGQATGNVNTQQRNVQSGCRFCGSLRWRDSQVAPLPDGNNRPSSEFYRHTGRR